MASFIAENEAVGVYLCTVNTSICPEASVVDCMPGARQKQAF